MDKLLIFIIVCASAILASCSTGYIPGVYRIDIRQGNVVTQEMLMRLKPGMDKQQVRFVLGSPLLIDTFHPDRWYYMYSFKPGNEQREQRTIITWFNKEGELSYISGQVKPSAPGEAEKIDKDKGEVSVIVPPRRKEQGLLGSLMNWLGFGDNSSG